MVIEMNELEKTKKESMKNLSEDRIKVEIEVSDNDFEKEVIGKSIKIPVIVDFWASWCMPCMMLGPILKKIAEGYREKFILAKVNVDENPETSIRYKISGIPAVKMFKNGKVIDEFVGALPEAEVLEWLNKNLGDD